jgi:hypothetical protein
MNKELDRTEKFHEYFNEPEGFSFRSERMYADLDVGDDLRKASLIVLWMKAAFLAGARTVAQDSVDTLRAYGTALAGIDEPIKTLTEGYDIAAESLMIYYTRVLQEAEKHEG